MPERFNVEENESFVYLDILAGTVLGISIQVWNCLKGTVLKRSSGHWALALYKNAVVGTYQRNETLWNQPSTAICEQLLAVIGCTIRHMLCFWHFAFIFCPLLTIWGGDVVGAWIDHCCWCKYCHSTLVSLDRLGFGWESFLDSTADKNHSEPKN